MHARERSSLVRKTRGLLGTDLTAKSAPSAARALGFAGVAPFVALTAAVTLGAPSLTVKAQPWLVAYGAIILSFMGGCRWGFAAAGLGDGPTFRPLALSVLPALYAWLISMLPFPAASVGLAIGFLVLFLADIALTRNNGAPDWWPNLRLPLTIGAAGSLFAAAVF